LQSYLDLDAHSNSLSPPQLAGKRNFKNREVEKFDVGKLEVGKF